MITVIVTPFSGLRSLVAVVVLYLTSFAFVPPIAGSNFRSFLATRNHFEATRAVHKLSREDELFLEEIEHRSFRYFWDQADSQTALVPDRARMDGSPLDENHQGVASIAATGFGLTGLCIAAERH